MPSKKILVVDDSRTSRFLERMILTEGGEYAVVMAEDGEEGVSKALAEVPDLILMDVVMPNMDGFEAVQQLRRQPTTRDIPVIMVTTQGEGPNVETGFEAGCNDYVTKPVDRMELLAKVERILQGS